MWTVWGNVDKLLFMIEDNAIGLGVAAVFLIVAFIWLLSPHSR